MKTHIPEKKPLNVFQARVYTIKDELLIKNTFLDIDEATNLITQYFKDEHYGCIFARGVIRTIEPRLKMWIVPRSWDNPHAELLDPEKTIIEKWKVTFYDAGDNIISSLFFEDDISSELIDKQLIKFNAFSAVISAHASDMPNDKYLITKCVRNMKFRMIYYSNKKYRPPSGNLEEVYKELLEQDYNESEKIKERFNNTEFE